MSLKWNDISKLTIVKFNGTNVDTWNDEVIQLTIIAGASHILGGDYVIHPRGLAGNNAISYTPKLS